MNSSEIRMSMIVAGSLVKGIDLKGVIGRGAIEGLEVRTFYNENDEYIGFAISTDDGQTFLLHPAGGNNELEDVSLNNTIPREYSDQWRNILAASLDAANLEKSDLSYLIIDAEGNPNSLNRRFDLYSTKLTKANVEKHIFVWSVDAFLQTSPTFSEFLDSGKLKHTEGVHSDQIGNIVRFNDISERIIFYKIK
jgi:hypothetical protein